MMMLHCRISSAHPNSKLEKVSRKKFGVTLTKKEHFLFPRNISNPQIQNKLQVNSEDVMDDLMPQTLAQPLTGTGGLRWYLGQILLFPELGGPSPAPRGHNDGIDRKQVNRRKLNKSLITCIRGSFKSSAEDKRGYGGVGVWDFKGKNGSSQEEGKTKVW